MLLGLNKLTRPQGLGYLMSSYTAHPGGFDEAEADAKQIAADMLQSGLVVFAPIAYGPGIDKVLVDDLMQVVGDADYYRSHEFWMPICERFFTRCDYGIIATTPGWHKSTGIAIELYALSSRNVPIWFYDVMKGQFLTLEEAYERWPDEYAELLQRAHDLKDKHLTYVSEIDARALGEVLNEE